MTEQPPRFPSSEGPDQWAALARYIAGESTSAERQSIEQWLAADPARAELLAALTRSIAGASFVAAADLDVETALAEAKKRRSANVAVPLHGRPERSRRGWSTTLLRVAAAFLILVGAALFWQVLPRGDVGATYTTGIGQTDSLNLPDGTRVVLAPSSELRVTDDFGEQERRVQLQGEALFEVQHDEARPFSVSAGPATIRDLGTRFTVRSYQAEPVRVVVTAGSVLLRATNAADSGVVLRAGESGELAGSAQRVQARPASAADVAWTSGRLVFENAPIGQVMLDLRRWYGIELQLSDPALANQHITATFEGETAQQVLEIVALALGAQIERRADTVFLGRRPAR